MKAMIIDGRAIARAVRREVRERTAKLKARGVVPGLGIVLAGGYAPSEIYVRSKERAGARVGIRVEIARFGDDVRREQLIEQVGRWNDDDRMHGMIVQLPLPDGIDSGPVIDAISPDKDADGLTPVSLGRLLAGRPRLVPATPAGIVELLVRSDIDIAGRSVVVVGRSELVGKPLANLLLLTGTRGDATVTVCRTADILVVAAGRPRLVTADMVRPGAVVIDVGTNRVGDELVGDVDFAGVARVASAITPVPGGVGPMTVAMLLHNTVRAAEARGVD